MEYFLLMSSFFSRSADSILSALPDMVGGDAAVALGLLFVGIIALVVGVGGLAFATNVIGRRLGVGASAAVGGAPQITLDQGPGTSSALLRRLERLVMPPPGQPSPIREKLIRAGYRSRSAVVNYYLARILLTVLVPTSVFFGLPVMLGQISFDMIMLLTGLLTVAGYTLPQAIIDRRIEARQNAVRAGFPDALDMLLVCVEAGLGLDAATQRMAMEIGHAHPVVAEEFLIAGSELRAGKNRIDTLRDLARRVRVDEVSSFVTVLGHSERFGSSIADTLRVSASEMRAKRLLRAEEMANKLPIKLSLAVSFCTVPAMIILLMAPAIVTVVRGLSGLMLSL
jgi:tight adherence protein C